MTDEEIEVKNWIEERKKGSDLMCKLLDRKAELEKENAELKKELESYKALDSHYDEIEEDAKRIAEENAELKADKEWLDNTNNQQTLVILELQQQIEKMKCCYNCKYGRIYFVKEIIVDCLANKVNPNNKYENCDKWKIKNDK